MALTKQKVEFDFEEELSRTLRRAERLRAAMKGSADVRYVDVKESRWIERHKRSAHKRMIITLRVK